MADSAIDFRMSHGPVSRQAQIRDFILHQITSGTWPEDYRIPSENELVAQLGVARMTVHHALKELRDRGFLTRVPGIGTFVAKGRNYVTIIGHVDIAAAIAERGATHSVEVLQQRVRGAAGSEAVAFKIAAGDPLLHAVVLHHENGHPVQLEDRLVNVAAAPGCEKHDIMHESLFAYLMRLRPYREGEETISARAASERERELLAMAPAEPCLEIRRTTWFGSEVVTAVTLLHPASRFNLIGRIASHERRP